MKKKQLQDKPNFKNFSHLQKWSSLSQEELLNDFKLSQFGLSDNEIINKYANFSKNIITVKQFNWFLKLLESFFNPFNILLFVIAAAEFIMYFLSYNNSSIDLVSGFIVLFMIVLSGIVDYFQQVKAFISNKNLKKMIVNKSKVIRNLGDVYHNLENRDSLSIVKSATNIAAEDLIPGDLLYLTIGDVIPCDVRVLVAKNFYVNQATLTGESIPVNKKAFNNNPEQQDNFIDLNNICYCGTNVTSGAAVCMILSTGSETYLASIAQSVNEKKTISHFSKGINWITRLLIISILVIAPIILVVTGIHTNNWINATIFAISVVVGLTPESLPMIIVANLTKGVKKLAKNKVVIKNNEAIQTLGAIDVLCTDKTGTLTEDKLKLQNYYCIERHNDPLILKYGFLNSLFQTGYSNLLDRAILDSSYARKWKKIDKEYQKLDEINFDFNRRRISIVLKNFNTNKCELVIKGAFEEIFSRSKYALIENKKKLIDEEIKTKIINFNNYLNSIGSRAISIAYREITEKIEYDEKDEEDLIFLGFLTFSDIPKKNVKETLKLLDKYNVAVKILTGDSLISTKSICQNIGFKISGILTGDDLDSLNESEILSVIDQTNIFAKLNPHQKAKIIKLLQQKQHIVGFLGDGINDSIALHQADVGITVDNASEIAKDAANIIMLEKSLLVLEKGIIEGRSIFVNIIKYIKLTVAANFGFMLSLFIGSLWFNFTPMIPIQLLFQNLIYDFSQLAVVFDRVDDNYITHPLTWNTKNILPFVIINGPVLTLISILNFIVAGYFFNFLLQSPSLMQTTYFTEGAIVHMIMIFIYRTDNLPIIKSRPTISLTIPILLFCSFIFALPYIPGIKSWLFFSQPIGWWYLWLLMLIIGFLVISEFMKRVYKHFYHSWLL